MEVVAGSGTICGDFAGALERVNRAATNPSRAVSNPGTQAPLAA